MKKLIKYFIYALPLVLFFSYYPLIHFGASESMNFEISLPIIWLVLFDLGMGFLMVKQKKVFRDFRKKWVWLLFPAFLTISVLWSLNSIRGILIVGILWLIYFAGYAIFSFKSMFDAEFSRTFLKWFFGSSLLVCFLCLLQCVLDLFGVSREWTLMCKGCTYAMFGFPHPNGFAIEPQFMGNLLLAPAIVAAWLYFKKQKNVKMLICFFIIVATLFLTFSRGAIYAFIVAMIFMTVFMRSSKSLVSGYAQGRSVKLLKIWLIIVLAFLFTLNLQGVMAEVSPTNDTYRSGVAKVLNHLSLGVIDIKGEANEPEPEDLEKTEAVFDGYVAESTDTRVKLTEMAIEVWSKDFKTALFGVGLGGAGQALYVNGLTSSPKEIVQNQYASLLLETGLVGILLLVMTLVLIVRAVCKRKNSGMVLSLMVAYGITLLFFSGLPNALNVYLLPIIFVFI